MKPARPNRNSSSSDRRSSHPRRPRNASPPAAASQTATYNLFRKLVNMPPDKLDHWLQTDESHAVGYKGRDGSATESVGHRSGRRILQILHRPKSELTDDDFAHMRKVIGYIKRHTAQRPNHPASELRNTRWRYSLMNWGHDPLK